MKTSILNQFEELNVRVLSGVEVDELLFSVPNGVKVIGFKNNVSYKNGEYKIDENLLDSLVSLAVISNNARNEDEKIEPFLEIYFEDLLKETTEETLQYARNIIDLAASVECSISLVGLHVKDVTAPDFLIKKQQYLTAYEFLVKAMLSKGNYSKYLSPFSLLFEIFFLEYSGEKEAMIEKRGLYANRLMQAETFSGALTEYAYKISILGDQDLELATKNILIAHFGSEEILSEVVQAMRSAVIDRMKNFVNEQQLQAKSRAERFGISTEVNESKQ